MGDKGKGIGGSILGYILVIVMFILLGGGFALVSNYVSSHSKQFSKAEYKDLNPVVEANEELPTGEWGKISIRFVVDTFATEENTYTTYGIKFGSGTSYYFLAVLDNYQIIAIQASDEAEVARLEAMSDAFWADDDAELISQDFEGKIEKMTNQELIGYYDDAVKQLKQATPGVALSPQYLILNTAAIPTQNVLLYVGVGVLAVILVIVLAKMRKKNKQESA